MDDKLVICPADRRLSSPNWKNFGNNELFHRHALGQISRLVHVAAARDGVSKFLGRDKRQAAFAVEKFFQPPVAGTRFATDNFRRDKIAHFAAKPPAFQPVFVADRAFNRNAGDF